jgi:hypothetical protein
LALPKAANIQTADGDFAIMEYQGGGNWRCLHYAKASGQALAGGRAPDAILMDRRASGSNGQTIGWTGFVTRELNTVAKDPGGIVTNYGSAFMLPAGTYTIRAKFLYNQYAYTDVSVVRLYSGATGAELGWSTNAYIVGGGSGIQGTMELVCEFTLAYAQSLRFDQWITANTGIDGPGGWAGKAVARANGIAGAPETYAVVEIYKEG